MKILCFNLNERFFLKSQNAGVVIFFLFIFYPFCTIAQQLYIPPDNPKISHTLDNDKTNNILDKQELYKIWVFFTDKGIKTAGGYLSAIEQPENLVSKRSLNRRATVLSSDKLVNFYDLPVLPKYISTVSARVEKWCTTSRWQNAVSVKANLAQIIHLEELPFVRKIKLVSRAS